ncbi:hypothetical protein OG21DRAFT_1492356 [Imleria badia]|nr:hypothetical protein OG21DRAFT_1492356 [Imleria badia]
MALPVTRIDEGIVKHTPSIRDIRSQRTLSPICRLPPELLATIFIRYAGENHDLDRFDPRWQHETDTGVPSWVNVSYVCRHWRAVALDCPTLWGYHFVVSLPWTEELLSRSQQASLKLCIMFNHTASRRWSFVEKLMNHTHRIQELILRLPDARIHQILSRLSSPAPRLQNLKIWVFSVEDVASGWDSTLFHGETPVLRTLELSSCPVPWYSLKHSGLTTLSLHYVPCRFQQDMEEFLATLSCMQDLTCLYLGQALPGCREFISSAAFNSFQRINLPHLSRLFIDAPLSTAVALLSCATLTFSASERNFDPIYPIVSHESRFWACEILLKIMLHWQPSWTGSDGDHIISNILFALPLAQVQSVHVLRPPFSPAFWRKSLAHLQDLRYIKLSNGFVPDLASVLYSTAHGDANQDATGDQDSNHILAPRLEELELCDIVFSPGGHSDLLKPAITQRCLFDALSVN